MKRVIIAAVLFAMLISIPAFAQDTTAQLNSIKVNVNGHLIDEPNILYAGRSYVPLRKIFEEIGCSVGWDETIGSAQIVGKFINFDESDILRTYDTEYAALKEQFDAIIASNIDNEGEVLRLEAELEAMDLQLQEKYAGVEDSVAAPYAAELPQSITVVDENGSSVQAETNTIRVFANGIEIDAPDILYNNRTYIPLRAVAEELGCTVDWDDATSTAFITAILEDVTVEKEFATYEEALADLNSKSNLETLKKTADDLWQEAYNYAIVATGRQDTEKAKDSANTDSDVIQAYANYNTALKTYEEKLAAIKIKFGIEE